MTHVNGRDFEVQAAQRAGQTLAVDVVDQPEGTGGQQRQSCRHHLAIGSDRDCRLSYRRPASTDFSMADGTAVRRHARLYTATGLFSFPPLVDIVITI